MVIFWGVIPRGSAASVCSLGWADPYASCAFCPYVFA